MSQNQVKENPLATAPVWSLISKFAVPAVISMLVTAIYNITDQIFIGQVVGIYGNAATNVAFPLVTLVMSMSLLLGFGSAANFNLNMGAKHKEEAARFAGTGISLMVLSGVVIALLAILFLRPLMLLFGATEITLPLAMTYTRITAIGIPFVLFTTASSNLIRADGSPTYAMFSNIVGAVLNVFLDALFMFGFGWGIAGAALATIVGQIVSALITLWYILHFKTVTLNRDKFRIRIKYVKAIASLGMAGFFTQFMMMLVQVTMNNVLNHYGSLSSYGSEIPFAVVAVISKLTSFVFAFLVGIGQGCQPIFGFNYGAGNYARVKETYKKGLIAALSISTLAFLLFQLFPRPIVSIFGNGTEEYFEFATRYMRIFMLMMFVNGMHPLTTNFFSAIGNARGGAVLSICRQGFFLIPLLLILPRFMGIDGVIYAGPISDGLAVIVSIGMVVWEMRKISRLEGK